MLKFYPRDLRMWQFLEMGGGVFEEAINLNQVIKIGPNPI